MNRLSNLTDQELNQNLKTLVSREREILNEILEHIKDIPTVALEIQAGNLNLSQISEIARGIKDKERSTFTKVSLEQKHDLVLSVLNKSTHETQALVAKSLDIKVVQHEKQKVQQDESVRLEITFSKNQHTKLNRCKDLLAASLFQKGKSDSWAEVIEHLADQLLKKVNQEPISIQKARPNQPDISDAETSGKDRDHEGIGYEVGNGNGIEANCGFVAGIVFQASNGAIDVFSDEVRDGASCEEGDELNDQVTDRLNYKVHDELTKGLNDRVHDEVCIAVKPKDKIQQKPPQRISKQLRQHILRRDQHCQYTDKNTGRKCGSTYGLEIDHKQSQWAGGLHEINNLQVLCKAHNIFKYKQEAFLN